ncbi:MAG: hypothetical protein JWN71_1398 [Xanthobacteraceae bacterium]|nr:hypothetical protein [Xanthobacteraceae bacterium]
MTMQSGTRSRRRTSSVVKHPPAIEMSPNFRALTSFERLTPEQKTFRVTNDGSAPHLIKGEYAVVDTADRELQHGELYLIQWDSGERSRTIAQVQSDHQNITGPGAAKSLAWWVCDLAGLRKTDEVTREGIHVFAGLSDGPYETVPLQSKIIGRIVGVATTRLGALLAPAAGYENEEVGNLAFDPAEYVDVMIATGHEPFVMLDAKGKPRGYYEKMPRRRQTKCEHDAVIAIRYKFCAASTALDRTMVECVRRGLIEGRRGT